MTVDLGSLTPPVIHAVLRDTASTYDVVTDSATGIMRCLEGGCSVVVVCVDRSSKVESRFAARLRHAQSSVPLLVVAGRANPDDMVSALDAGADDYLPGDRPPAELAARARALSRREPDMSFNVLTVGDLTLNPTSHKVTCDGEDIGLSSMQFNLLEVFVRNADIALTRDQLFDKVWDHAANTSSNVVDQAVAALRRTIGHERISTIRGIGYRFESNVQRAAAAS